MLELNPRVIPDDLKKYFRPKRKYGPWICRNVITWYKRSAMPESVKDRFSRDFENIFFFSANPHYYFEQQFEQHVEPERGRGEHESDYKRSSGGGVEPTETKLRWTVETRQYNPLGRNARTVWHGNEPLPYRLKDSIPKEQLDWLVKTFCEPYTVPQGDVWDVTPTGTGLEHYACVSEDTECLTINGWKNYKDIKRGNYIAAYDKESKVIKFVPCSHIRTYKVDTKLFHIGQRCLDALVTADHRNIVIDRYGEELVKTASGIQHMDKILTRAPLDCCTNGGVGEDTAALLGWVITEGNYDANGGISISQNEGINADKIRLLLRPYSYTERHRKGARQHQIEFHLSHLSSMTIKAILPKKELYRELAFLPVKECESLFNALLSGDGHRRKDDGRIMFVQKNKQTTDWFTILALRLGYLPLVTITNSGIYHVHLTKKTSITTRGTDGLKNKVELVDYKGIVWCPTTKYGTWVARRNGKMFITGNSYPVELCRRPILAGCPEFLCPKCGKPRTKIYKGSGGAIGHSWHNHEDDEQTGNFKTASSEGYKSEFIGYSDCGCQIDGKLIPLEQCVPGVVLDPFAGTFTTSCAAKMLGRRSIGIEISESYCQMGVKRLKNVIRQGEL